MSAAPPEPTPTAPSLPRPRSPWVQLLLLLVVFLSGAICGAGASAVIVRNVVRNVVHHPEQASDRLVRLAERRLALTDTQLDEIAQILHRRQAQILKLRQQVQPEVERELSAAANEVAAVLTPTQRQQWRRLVERLRGWRPPLPTDAPGGG